jgi:uncharacterized protein YlzI (FlbEa/FlbD family)
MTLKQIGSERMKFIRAKRTNGANVLINIDHIAAMEHQDADQLNYTAIILNNGREIDVTETLDELVRQIEMILGHEDSA